MDSGSAARRDIHVIIPFYKNADLVDPLFASLAECASELSALNCTIVAVNDSPGDAELEAALARAVDNFPVEVQCRVRTNAVNLGFLKSVNSAVDASVEATADVILLNSDTRVFRGSFTELQRVAYADSMIGFVSPRSNNATICTFPHQPDYRDLPPQESHEVFRTVAGYLPEFHYVPTAVGFCLYIKFEILNEFGCFDETYGKGYNEENDLIMRANRYGYRSVLANHAFVYHIGEQSFSISDIPKSVHEERNARLLHARFPEYAEHIPAYFSSDHYQAERLLGGLIPDSDGRIDVLFDCSHFGPYHNGTFSATKRILIEAARHWRTKFNITVLATPAIAAFHNLYTLPGVLVSPLETTRVFGIAFRFGQPFDYDALIRLNRLAPVNVYGMLDTIAWDCLHLNRNGLDDIWRAVALYSDGLLYISDFNREQFRLRFPVREGMAEKASYLSLNTAEYGSQTGTVAHEPDPGSYILVVGNAFAHKYVEPTVRALVRRFPRMRVVALGLNTDLGQNVTVYSSGQLSGGEITNLFDGALCVVFPSTYEGFGLPLMESLGYRKPVFVRDGPLNRAMHRKLGNTGNVRLYCSTKNLLQQLQAGIPEWVDDMLPAAGNVHSWANHAEDIRQLLESSLHNFSFENTLLPRTAYLRLAERAGLRKEPSMALDDSDSADAVIKKITDMEQTSANGRPDPVLNAVERESHAIREYIESIIQRDRRVTDLQNHINALEAVVRDREKRIGSLLDSVSWKITAPLRSIGSLWIRPNEPRSSQ